MIVIITEKPSVAQEYKKALQINSEKHNGYLYGHSNIINEDVAITWCYGHLCELSYPEAYGEALKQWSMDTLPFLPKNYLYNVKSNVKEQFGIIKSLYNEKILAPLTRIYYAGDSGREGLYIQMLVRQLAGHKAGIDERIVWIDSYTESEILRGIREAKPVSAYDKQIAAAYMRAIEDFMVGINFSRALSLKFGYAFKNKSGSEKAVIPVGRVMTCVLAMVVEREREIRNFKETPFYGVIATMGNGIMEAKWKAVESSKYYNSPLLYNETGFKLCDNANELCMEFTKNPTLTVSDIRVTTESKNAPMLFNLAEAQNFCSQKYKMSPNETLEVIQSLYEKKLVTYPRTDARVLSSAVASEIKNNLQGLIKLGYKIDNLKTIAINKWHIGLEKTRYVDDSKITDHYAIIPTGYIQGAETLNEKESNVYHDIIDRFLCIFYPPAKYLKAEAEFIHANGEKLYLNQKTLQEYGYLEVIKESLKEGIVDNQISRIKKGASISTEYSVKEGKTTPPKRYTSGSMVIAMENAGNLIEDEELRNQIKGAGIGTSATRAAIIDKLVHNKHLDLNKKTQVLTPLIAGECIYDIVKDVIPEFLTPKMTANWETGLQQIEDGKITATFYREKLEEYIKKEVDKIKAKESSGMTSYNGVKGVKSKTLENLLCPKCQKGYVTETQKAYGCSEYKNGCDFVIWKSIAGKTLTTEQVSKLITKGHTSVIKGFKSKSGKSFEARVIYANGKTSFEFPEKDD